MSEARLTLSAEETSFWTLVRGRAALVGLVGVAICALAAAIDYEQFVRCYLIGWLFWFGISLGSLAFCLLHNLTGGVWGLVVRRSLESAAAMLPLVAILFLPIAFDLPALFEWARPEAVAADKILQEKAPYLNSTFFLARAGGYFVIWITISLLSRRLRGNGIDTPISNALLQPISGVGLVVYALTVTFASGDWIMSLDAHWFSTIFGFLTAAAQGMAGIAAANLVLGLTTPEDRLPRPHGGHGPDPLRDLNNLMLAFVMLWSYMWFMQFLIIWYGNLPEETRWYAHREQGGWQVVGVGLGLLQFAAPFLALLAGPGKVRTRPLAMIAAWILFMRWVDLFWLVKPSFFPGRLMIEWPDFVVTFAIGGLWVMGYATYMLRTRDLVTYNVQGES